MILDKQALFSDAQAITASAASTNQYDCGATGTPSGSSVPLKFDLGISDIPLLIQVVEDFATLTSLTVTIQTDSDVAFGSPATAWTSGAIPVASLKAGYKFAAIFAPLTTNERYVRLNYTVGGSNATAGKITAGFTTGVDRYV